MMVLYSDPEVPKTIENALDFIEMALTSTGIEEKVDVYALLSTNRVNLLVESDVYDEYEAIKKVIGALEEHPEYEKYRNYIKFSI